MTKTGRGGTGRVASGKPAGVDPFAGFRDVLARIPTHPADRMHEFIPREWKTRFGPRPSPAAPAVA